MKSYEIIAFVLWTIAIALLAAAVATKLQPPSPILYRVEVREKEVSLESCKQLVQKYYRRKG